jgi:hypothetical protein
MTPEEDGTGTLEVEALNYENSKSVIRGNSTPAAPDKIVGDFWKVIAGRHLYAFKLDIVDGKYFGCRKWVYVPNIQIETRH